jgi:hypothetical protein
MWYSMIYLSWILLPNFSLFHVLGSLFRLGQAQSSSLAIQVMTTMHPYAT